MNFNVNTMQISRVLNMNFGAKLLSRTDILQYNEENDKYVTLTAAFVELDP